MYGNQPPGGGGYGGPPGGGGYGGPPGGGGYGGPPGGPPPGGGGYGAPPGAPPPGGGYGQPPGGYGQPPGYPPPQGYGMQQPGFGPPGYGMQPGGGKAKMVTLLLAIIPSMFGFCGIHRFYTGHIGIGIAQFLTFGGCGVWQLIDIIFIFTGKYTDSNGQPLQSDDTSRQLGM